MRLLERLLFFAQPDPAAPEVDTLAVYAKKITGRMLLKHRGPSGIDTPLQTSLFQNSVALLTPGQSSGMSFVGAGGTTNGTVTVPAATEALGYGQNFATGATAGNAAGATTTTNMVCRGTLANGSNGFFFLARLAFPDANYGTGATGARIFVGLTDQTMANMATSDNPAGHRVGFAFNTALNDTNWMLTSKDNTTETRTSSGVAFTTGAMIDFYLYCPPLGTSVMWRIDNLNAGTTAEGTITATLPGASTMLKGGFNIATLTTTARNVRMNRIYLESDR